MKVVLCVMFRFVFFYCYCCLIFCRFVFFLLMIILCFVKGWFCCWFMSFCSGSCGRLVVLSRLLFVWLWMWILVLLFLICCCLIVLVWLC